MIKKAKESGFDCVKFQMRTTEAVFSKEELDKPRVTPFGTTNGDYKRGIEFNQNQYRIINEYCLKVGIDWSASPWDVESVDRLMHFDPPFIKVASPCLTDFDLLWAIVETGKPTVLSTGMSTMEEIDVAYDRLLPQIMLHCVSTYPSLPSELNLKTIRTLMTKYPRAIIGYSGHERELETTIAARAIGAMFIERHVTLDRDMWGSDQKASLNFEEAKKLNQHIRNVERAIGDGVKRVLLAEEPIKQKLRKNESE